MNKVSNLNACLDSIDTLNRIASSIDTANNNMMPLTLADDYILTFTNATQTAGAEFHRIDGWVPALMVSLHSRLGLDSSDPNSLFKAQPFLEGDRSRLIL